MRINIFFIEKVGLIATVNFEKYVAGACIIGVVIGKLSHWEKPSQIILLVVNKSPKVGFYCAILSLSFIVSLKIKDDKKPLFYL